MKIKQAINGFYRSRICLVLLLSSFCTHIFAQATFLIWPIYPNIESNEKATALWLENTGKSEAMIQVRVFKWDQQRQKDNYEIQTEIIPSPPIVKVTAGGKNMVRLTRTRPVLPNTEQAYRIIIDELPIKFDKDASENSLSLSFQIRYSIPLFSYGQGIGSGLNQASVLVNAKNTLAQPILSFWTEQLSNAETTLYIKNSGMKFARLSEIRLTENGKPLDLNHLSVGYILANSTMKFSLNNQLANDIRHLNALYVVDSSGAALKVIALKRAGQ